MDHQLASLIILAGYRIVSMFVGLGFGFMGYRLLDAGIYSAQSMEATWGNRKVLVRKAAPGTVFAIFGAVVVTFSLWKGFSITPAAEGAAAAGPRQIQAMDSTPNPAQPSSSPTGGTVPDPASATSSPSSNPTSNLSATAIRSVELDARALNADKLPPAIQEQLNGLRKLTESGGAAVVVVADSKYLDQTRDILDRAGIRDYKLYARDNSALASITTAVPKAVLAKHVRGSQPVSAPSVVPPVYSVEVIRGAKRAEEVIR